MAKAAVGFGNLLTLGEDGTLEAHEDVNGIGIGFAGWLVDEEHARPEQVVDSVA